MDKNEFISKEKGLIVVRLNPEQLFNVSISRSLDYHYSCGLNHGLLLEKEIQEMAKYLPEFLKKTRGKLMGAIAYQFLIKKAKSMKKFIPAEYLAEINGVAMGAGVDPNSILLINVFDELKNIYGCSALAVEENNNLLYGVNTDYAVFGDFLGPRNTVFVYQQKKPYHNFVSVAWPGYVGLIRGMNNQGTVLISTASYSKDQRIKGIPTSFLYRAVIEKFNSDSVLPTAQRTIGNNVLMGRKQEAGIIEVSAKRWSARGTKTIYGRKFITATNHYQTEEMKKSQRQPKPVRGSTIPPNEMDKYFWDFFGLKGSEKRNDELQRQITEFARAHHPEFTPEIIKIILSQVASPYTTLNSLIFDPANLKLYIANNQGKMPATNGKLVEINVGNLFKL